MPPIGPGGRVELAEADVRRLCGPAAFARAAALQRAGHVLSPTTLNADEHRAQTGERLAGTVGSILTADVRGTWWRVDAVKVTWQQGRPTSSCSCGASGFCRHAGALLLHWLRDPASFVVAGQSWATGAPGAGDRRGGIAFASAVGNPVPPTPTPTEELARCLEQDVLPHLREIARRRRVSVSARGKADLIVPLAAALADPANVDAAIATLGPEARLALDVVHVLSAGRSVGIEAIGVGYRALGGREDVPLTALLDLGLVMPTWQSHSPAQYWVPRAVVARLPLLERESRPQATTVPPPAASASPCLAIGELLQVVAQDLIEHDVRRRAQPARPDGNAHLLASGWRIDAGGSRRSNDAFYDRQKIRLLPPLPLIDDPDLSRLANRTGQAPAAIAFAVHLLVALGLVDPGDRLRLRDDRWQALLGEPSAARWTKLIRGWLAMPDWTVPDLVLGPAGPLQLWSQPYYGSYVPVGDLVTRLRQLVARLIGRISPGVWYDFDSLLGLVRKLEPRPLGPVQVSGSRPLWWLTSRELAESPLDLDAPGDWQRGYGAFVGALLAGPLSWLGLVEVVPAGLRPSAFRVRPAAGILVEREAPEDALEQPTRLIVAPDLTVLIPAGTTDSSAHAALAAMGELVEASAAGLRYRLEPERVHGLFEAGMTGPDLVRFLESRTEAGLPEPVRTTLARWWAGYGGIHLYDDLAIVELGDDFLLAELLATSSLGKAVLHNFSPRLIAVPSNVVDDLVAELTRLGHAPRVAEEL